MHFIARTRVSAPSCLAKLGATQCTWDDVTYDQREEMRESLKQLDESRCAYCEVYVQHLQCHIEHFQTQRRSPQLRFEWGNLFLSCNRNHTCGTHKDNSPETRQRKYIVEDLVKPDEEDPERFIQFYADGTIRVRAGIGDRDKRRAEETLRVFNLRHGGLRKMREIAVNNYLNAQFEFFEFLDSLSVVEQEVFLQGEIRETEKDEYVTTIKHFLLSLLRPHAER